MELLHLLLHRIVLVDVLLNSSLQVLGIVEQRPDSLNGILKVVKEFLAFLACLGFDTTDTRSNTSLANNLEHTDMTRAVGVNTTAELHTRTELNHSYLITIFLTEQGNSTQFLCFFDRCLAEFFQTDVLTDHVID